ncbi:hypothetical protein C8F01DRAFT_1092926 [Mycena amicta]|nr:hypothetical protein C8F01DRAFT_1092926 [Mycena amicta]
MPPPRSTETGDQALISCLPARTLEVFRDSIYQEAYVVAHTQHFHVNRDWVSVEPLRAWLESRAPTSLAPCVPMPAIRSSDDDMLIKFLPQRTLELFRGSVYRDEYIWSNAARFEGNYDWINPEHLRAWLENPNATNTSTNIHVKSEPSDVAMDSSTQFPPVYRVLNEGGKEVLEIESDSDDARPALPARHTTDLETSSPLPAPNTRAKTSPRVHMEEVEDEDEIRDRARGQRSLSPDSRHTIEPLMDSMGSDHPPSSSSSMPSPSFDAPASTDAEPPVPRAPATHRSPEAFNRHTDWRPSGTDWGNPKLQSFVRDTDFKPTSHRAHPVTSIEYIFDPVPYIPVPHDHRAILVDLDEPRHDILDDQGKLKTVLTRIRNECHDSFEGPSGTAASDSKPKVTYGPGETPIRSFRARLACRGGFGCALADPSLATAERRYLDPEVRQALFSAERKICAEEGRTEPQRVTEFINAVRGHKCGAVDAAGNRCEGRALLVRSQVCHGYLSVIVSDSPIVLRRGWKPTFKRGHRRQKITVDYAMFEKAWHGEAMVDDSSKDTARCAGFIPPHVGERKKFCDHSHVVNGIAQRPKITHFPCEATCTIFFPVDPTIRKALILPDPSKPHPHPLTSFVKLTDSVAQAYNLVIAESGPLSGATVGKVDSSHAAAVQFDGLTPGQFAPALQSTTVKNKLLQKAKGREHPAGVGLPGVLHLYEQDVKKPNPNDRYVQRFVTTPDGGNIILTAFPQLLALLDEVDSFQADATFKRVAGELNEWEVVVFYKALNRNVTVARVYINRASAEFFELVFDELQALKLRLTGKPLAFKRLVPDGNLLVFNSDMESAQVLGAAASFLKTRDREHSDLPDDITPHEFAPHIIKLCITHAKRAILDFEKLVPTRDYLRLLNFADEIKSEASLDVFSDFVRGLGVKKIQDWWDHKEMSAWILPCLVKSLSPLDSDEWESTPATTNAGESQHHWTNTQTGIKLAPVEAIERARIVDLRVLADIQVALNSGVLPNQYSTSLQRKLRGIRRDAAKAAKRHDTREREEEVERIEDDLERVKRQQQELTELAKSLKAQKKEVKGTHGKAPRATAGVVSTISQPPLHDEGNNELICGIPVGFAHIAPADVFLPNDYHQPTTPQPSFHSQAPGFMPTVAPPSPPGDLLPDDLFYQHDTSSQLPFYSPMPGFVPEMSSLLGHAPLDDGPEFNAFLANLGLDPSLFHEPTLARPSHDMLDASDFPNNSDMVMRNESAQPIPRPTEYLIPNFPSPSPPPLATTPESTEPGPSAKPTRKRKRHTGEPGPDDTSASTRPMSGLHEVVSGLNKVVSGLHKVVSGLRTLCLGLNFVSVLSLFVPPLAWSSSFSQRYHARERNPHRAHRHPPSVLTNTSPMQTAIRSGTTVQERLKLLCGVSSTSTSNVARVRFP